jgi:hypothetical protein
LAEHLERCPDPIRIGWVVAESCGDARNDAEIFEETAFDGIGRNGGWR